LVLLYLLLAFSLNLALGGTVSDTDHLGSIGATILTRSCWAGGGRSRAGLGSPSLCCKIAAPGAHSVCSKPV
jgi:hypothetical protein